MAYHCNTCGLTFSTIEEMKEHYESDLHKENVRRRVNGLVPLTAQSYGARSRVATSVQSMRYRCTICNKSFSSAQTLMAHLQSQKHKEKKAQLKRMKEEKERKAKLKEEEEGLKQSDVKDEDPKEDVNEEEPKDIELKKDNTEETIEEVVETKVVEQEEDVEEESKEEEEAKEKDEKIEIMDTATLLEKLNKLEPWEENPARVKYDEALTSSDCLFCNIRCPTPEAALCHMMKDHGFTIPLAHLVTDMEGLLSYLALKVNAGICLVCGDKKMFETREGLQSHMKELGHQYITLDDGEYSEFYHPSVRVDQDTAAAERARNLKIKLSNGKHILSKKERLTRQAPPQPIQSKDISQEKKLLTEGSRAHMTLAQMSRYKELLQAREKLGKKEERMDRQHQREVNKQRMRLGVHLNNQHGKGYQGDYVGKTI